MKILFFLILLLISATFSKKYDYIIVGGGSAGCVLAAELSADPAVTVLLLEQGDDDSDLFSRAVGFFGAPIYGAGMRINEVATENAYLDHYFSQEYNLGLRSLLVHAPRTLGGGTSINGGAFGRPSTADFASWNNSLWTYSSTNEDWKSLEKCTTLGTLPGNPCDPLYHGSNGSIVTKVFQPNALLEKIKDVMPPVYGVPMNDDINGPDATGVGNLPRNLDLTQSKRRSVYEDEFTNAWTEKILEELPAAEKVKYFASRNISKRNIEQFDGEPVRQDSWTKLLKPFINRSNLKVLIGAKGLKLEYAGNGKHSVIYQYDNTLRIDKSDKEVIASLGIYNTPKFLMHSGIGDCQYLESIGIDCVINNPHVGKNLQDGVLSSMVYVSLEAPPPTPNFGGIVVGHYKSTSFADEGTDIEVAFSSVTPDGGVVLVMLGQLRHNQMGSLRIKSKNPNLDPFFNLNFYTFDSDVDPMVELFKKTRTAMFLANASLFEIRPGYAAVPLTATDDQIREYFKSGSIIGPEFHGVGTASMNKVVNGRLQLINSNGDVIPGIRVADLSIVPTKLRTHSTSSISMLIGKTGSRLIKEDHA